ncbi:MAG: response regulator [Candidatus Delongbacteria bacterium]|nr:response regulator [Candidatus Delongbacteria bacterium]MBN2835214.1 response regulator [Candidatus Delongbacteria bacterium]
MRNILIVDDESYVRTLFSSVVELFEDYHVDTAVNGYDAVQKVMNNTYNLILMDLKMPKMSGLEAIRAIRLLQNKTPIVIITGYASDKMKEDGLKAGANLFLSKPVSIKDLKGHIHYFVEEYIVEDDPVVMNDEIGDLVIEEKEDSVIVIGSSVGGPMDFIEIMNLVTVDSFPPIIMVQHMPEGFIIPVAKEIEKKTGRKVVIVEDEAELNESTIYFSSNIDNLIIKNKKVLKEMGDESSHFLPSISGSITAISNEFRDKCIVFLLKGLSVHLDSKAGLLSAQKNESRVFALNDNSHIVKKMAEQSLVEGLTNIEGMASLIDKLSVKK